MLIAFSGERRIESVVRSVLLHELDAAVAGAAWTTTQLPAYALLMKLQRTFASAAVLALSAGCFDTSGGGGGGIVVAVGDIGGFVLLEGDSFGPEM